jgi:hypothetical protein
MRKFGKLSLSRETIRNFEVSVAKVVGGATAICVTNQSGAGNSCHPVVCFPATVASGCC